VFDTDDLLVAPGGVPPGAELVDVREPYEWAAGHIPGSRHVPIDTLAEALPDLPGDRPVVLVCLGGLRAAMCAAALRTTGLDVRVLDGGLRGWVAAGLALDRRGATLAPHGRPPDRA
jgi:rhodanese-related sulfurtransferase